jgi:hypothetical protein
MSSLLVRFQHHDPNEDCSPFPVAVARELDLPYVRFKIIFVEGTFRGGGGYQGEVSCVDVTPALIQVGDNNNIFSELPIAQMDPKSMSMKEAFQTRKIEQLDEFTKDCAWLTAAPGSVFNMKDAVSFYDSDGPICYALRVADTETDTAERLWPSDAYSEFRSNLTVLPGDVTVPAEDGEHQPEPALFHRDADGKTCFSDSEASQACEHIAAMALDERVKQCLQRKLFDLPQESAMVQSTFCNESLFGTMNMLEVTGVVRMDSSDRWTFERAAAAESAKAPPAVFDAWPSADVRRESEAMAAFESERDY